MIESFMTWWDNHPGCYFFPALGSLLLLLAWLLPDLLRETPRVDPPPRWNEVFFFVALFITVLTWRWPYLLFVNNFNPDESQILAGAITLLHKPLFWRYVDGHTAGPVDFYALTLPGLLGLPISFFVARTFALLAIVAATWFSYGILCFFAPARVARLAILPAVLLIAATRDWDFLAVTSEHIPVFLLAAGGYLTLLARKRGRDNGALRSAYWVPAGLAIGLAPWAKLQAAPAAAVLVAVACLLIFIEKRVSPFDKTKALSWFLGAAILPSVGFLLIVVAIGEWSTLHHSYISSNLSYITVGASYATSLRQMLEATALFNIFQAFIVACALCFGLFGALSMWRRRGLGVNTLASIGGTVVAFAIILIPRRGFPHYLLFLVLPLGLCAAMAFTDWWKLIVAQPRIRRISTALYCAAGLLPILGVATAHGPAFPLGGLTDYRQNPYTPLANTVHPFVRARDTVAMWGWFPQIFVELQVAQATREAHTQRLIEPSALQSAYRARYMADLTASYPVAIVDAVGPAAFGFHERAKEGHESFPALARYISDNYSLVADLPEGRVYIRNNRVGSR